MLQETSVNDRTNGRWNKEEHDKFILGLKLYGKNWKKIQELVVTRNGSQIRSHAQKYFMKLNQHSGDFLEDIENMSVVSPVKCKDKEITNNLIQKKSKKIKLSSPNFWEQISELVKTPGFTFWEMIEQTSTHEQESSENGGKNEGEIKDRSFVPYEDKKSTALRENTLKTNLL